MQREAEVKRTTKETDISARIVLDGAGDVQVDTGVPFLDHMLTSFARHGGFGLSLSAKGDLQVDAHHTIEDVGLVLGQAVKEALGNKAGIERFGYALVPMDDALARVALDLSGRPFLGYRVQPTTLEVGGFKARLFREFFQALANTGGITLHIDLLAGEEVHHIFEAIFKAFGKALPQAVQRRLCCDDVPSTKGVL